MHMTAPATAARASSTPRVSVVTIFYNAETYLAEAIESVLAQDYRDFEFLLVDDGSNDRSTGIARDYVDRNPDRLRYLEHPRHANRGMSAARNLGLREARGDLVAFIDADDRWRPSKLGAQVALLDRMPDVEAVGGSVNYWSSHGGGKDRIVRTGHVRGRSIPPGEATRELYPLGRADAPSMSDLLLRRTAVEKVGGFEEAFTGAYEDQAFLAKLYLASTLYFSDETWSDYRLHENSCMAQVGRNGTYGEARNAFLAWFEDHLSTTAFRDDPSVQRALRRALKPHERRETLRQRLSRSFVGDLVRGAKGGLRRLRPLLAPGPAILMYHRIADESFDPWGLAVSSENFADQLDWIRRNRLVLSLPDFVELHRQGKLPRSAAALTFDDGYACNADVAVPLLEKLGIPATIFLPAGLIERGCEFWWDELERIVLDSESRVLTLGGRAMTLGERHSEDSNWPPATKPRTARQRAYHWLWSMLYEIPPDELEANLRQLRDQSKVPEAPRDSHRPMSPVEVQGSKSALIDFGSHALSHASLPSLAADEKAREIVESMEQCTKLVGARPRCFAYPYGNYDADSARLAQQAGYDCAVKAEGRFVGRRSNPFALPRLFVGNWSRIELARQLGRP